MLCLASCWAEHMTAEPTCTNTQSSVSCHCDYRTIANMTLTFFIQRLCDLKTAARGLFVVGNLVLFTTLLSRLQNPSHVATSTINTLQFGFALNKG